MEIQGRLIQICEPVTGEGRNGQWKRQDFVIETQTQYPRKACFSVVGDKVDTSNLQLQSDITVSINLESREYNGRWFTDVRAWRITPGAIQQSTSVDVVGKVISVLEPKSGVGKNGKEWKMQEFVIETQEQYPKKICFSIWGDRIDKSILQIGETVTVSVDIDSRQGTNGNWFTSIQAYKVLKGIVQTNPAQNATYGVQAASNPDPLANATANPVEAIQPEQLKANDETDQLPF